MVVITFLLRRRPELSPDEFHTYWREQHGPLVASHAGTLGIRRYEQLHTVDSPTGPAIATTRDCEATDWDGVALIWFDDEAALVEAATGTPEGQAAAAALLEDERRFVDLDRCQLFLSEDHRLVG